MNDHPRIDDSQTLELLRSLIKADTVDPPGNEYRAADIVEGFLKREGIETTVYEVAPGRTNLVARVRGAGEKKSLIFSAHFDTIPVNPDEWSYPPFGAEIVNGKVYGRGATDMKSGMAAMVAAAASLHRSGRALKGDLVLAFSAAENSTSLGAKKLVEDGHLQGAGALLVSEPSSLKAFVAEKGALWLLATASGESGHHAFIEGVAGDRGNAILRMAEFLCKLPGLDVGAPKHRHLRPPTVNVGRIVGGISPAMIPPVCTAEIDIRMVPGLEPGAVLAQFRAIAGEHIRVEQIEFKPPVDTPDDHPFVTLCLDACREELGTTAGPAGVPYYSDGAIIAPRLNIPMVIIGPGEVGMSGSVDEYVELDKLHKASRIFLRIAGRYLG